MAYVHDPSQSAQSPIPMVQQQPMTPAPGYGEKAPDYPQQQPMQQDMYGQQTQQGMYGQQQPMYQQPMQQPVQQVPQQGGAQPHQFLTAMPLAALSRSPAPVDCPSCGARALTACSYQSGDNTHLWALIFCFLICAPCIPYVVKGFKDVQHSCGNCAVPLALWHKSGGVDVLIHA